MNYTIEIKKKLKTDNNKHFSVGEDIGFGLLNQATQKEDRYIGEIKKINDDSIVINKIECKNKDIKTPKEMTVLLSDILPNSCCYVYYD